MLRGVCVKTREQTWKHVVCTNSWHFSDFYFFLRDLFLYFLPLICPHLCPFWRGNTRSCFLYIISPYWICFCQLQQFWTQKTQETPKACNHTAGISLCRTQFVNIYPLKGCSFSCVCPVHMCMYVGKSISAGVGETRNLDSIFFFSWILAIVWTICVLQNSYVET